MINTKPVEKTVEIIIEGITHEGKPFRPSDWVDRMCSTFATFGENRKLRYSPYLRPEMVNGVRCLAVDMQLKNINRSDFQLCYLLAISIIRVVN